MSPRADFRRSGLEQGWLLAEMELRFGYSLDELGCRFDRSASWVSRRLALVELLPESIQQQVREGKIAAQIAMKYLVTTQEKPRNATHWSTRSMAAEVGITPPYSASGGRMV
jgi:hypothetical protein